MLGGEDYSMLECPMANMERSTGKWRCTNTESAPNCPRCASTNTKFCYYNNYSLSQPRYFCKACRRYWTKGGSLRNVPVGGGCRKSRRSRASRHAAGATSNYHPQTLLGQRGGPGESGSGVATDIDLAAVFARYVSQNVDVSGSPGGSSGSSSENIPAGASEVDCHYLDEMTMLEYQTPLDLINGGEDRGIPGISSVEGGMMNGQDFVYQDCSGYDLLHQQQGVGGDDLGILWSDEGTTNLSNYEWQQQTTTRMQMGDFGNFLPDDQFRESGNLSTENWGFFDLAAYDYCPSGP